MDIRKLLFQHRSFVPIPFLVVMTIFAQPTTASFVTGLLVVLGGEYLRLWGVAIAGSETRTTDRVGGTFLITTGPFAYVRNPLYLGNILMYFGFGVMSMALFPWLPLIALAFFTWQYSLIIQLEEEHLAERFGDDYRFYRTSVQRFVPTLKKYKAASAPQPEISWRRGLHSEKRTLQAVILLTGLIYVLWRVRG